MTDAWRYDAYAPEKVTEETCDHPVKPRRPSRAKTRHVCPVCKRPLARQVAGSTIVFPPLKSRIFYLIKNRPGITTREIADIIYERTDEAALVTVRVHVSQMREMLRDGTDMRIESFAGSGYWLELPNGEPAVG